MEPMLRRVESSKILGCFENDISEILLENHYSYFSLSVLSTGAWLILDLFHYKQIIHQCVRFQCVNTWLQKSITWMYCLLESRRNQTDSLLFTTEAGTYKSFNIKHRIHFLLNNRLTQPYKTYSSYLWLCSSALLWSFPVLQIPDLEGHPELAPSKLKWSGKYSVRLFCETVYVQSVAFTTKNIICSCHWHKSTGRTGDNQSCASVLFIPQKDMLMVWSSTL